jgi:hypothetical protein
MIVFYLIGAFIAASFDISQWDIHLRGCVSVFGFMYSLLFTSAITKVKSRN